MVRAPYRKLPKITPESLPEWPIGRVDAVGRPPRSGTIEAKAMAFVKPGGTAIKNDHRPGRSDAFGVFCFGQLVTLSM